MKNASARSMSREISRHEDEIPSIILVALTAALVALIAAISPKVFGIAFFGILLRQAVVVGVAALGQSLLMISGGIDISVGANAGLAAIIGATVMVSAPEYAIAAIPIGLAVGMLIGLANGVLVIRGRANPFIITLGTMAVLQGVTLAISPTIIEGLPDWYVGLYSLAAGPVPIATIVLLLLGAGTWLIMARTRLGRHFYAVGGNREAARFAGIAVDRISLIAYVLCGLYAAGAGLFAMAQAGVGTAAIGDTMAFSSITAAALAGVSLYGGRGHVAGALLGAIVLTLLLAVLTLLGMNPFLQQFVQGAVIMLAVAVYRAR